MGPRHLLAAAAFALGGCGAVEPAPAPPAKPVKQTVLPSLRVKVLKIETGRVVIPPRDYGRVQRAEGRFVLVALRLRNTGPEPLRGLYEAKLQLGTRSYEQSDEATFTATPINAFPLAPGDTGVAAVVFDLPVAVADAAAREGVLRLPAGAIRLAEA